MLILTFKFLYNSGFNVYLREHFFVDNHIRSHVKILHISLNYTFRIMSYINCPCHLDMT